MHRDVRFKNPCIAIAILKNRSEYCIAIYRELFLLQYIIWNCTLYGIKQNVLLYKILNNYNT